MTFKDNILTLLNNSSIINHIHFIPIKRHNVLSALDMVDEDYQDDVSDKMLKHSTDKPVTVFGVILWYTYLLYKNEGRVKYEGEEAATRIVHTALYFTMKLTDMNVPTLDLYKESTESIMLIRLTLELERTIRHFTIELEEEENVQDIIHNLTSVSTDADPKEGQ